MTAFIIERQHQLVRIPTPVTYRMRKHNATVISKEPLAMSGFADELGLKAQLTTRQ